MRELLVSDLDGTLLRPDGKLGTRTVRTVNRFLADGGLFTYATARSFASAARATAALDLTLPVITYGGAMMVDPRTGDARPAHLLDQAVVDTVLSHCTARPSLQPILFVMREDRDRVCWLTDHHTPAVDTFLSYRRDDPRLLPLTAWSQIDLAAVISIALIGSPEALLPVRTDLDAFAATCHAVYSEDVYAPGEWWVELTSSAATKAAAVAALRDEIGATSLTCFGDGPNDGPMFAIADRAIAVANAIPELRAAAHSVIGSNADEAVATWIASHGARARGGAGVPPAA
ncbi:HAD family hydrolase [Actinoplanes sp. NBRC 103695]|uniref:HAD-IIB family hydrolase n=1 Tax=Actinoplanes sp. NBRC 103695 TaxID=3032202 RepID=UPI0025532BD3|nr:HAD family hydrolase [Actinoplanes sp. NBRC 103695]